ncbi:MAG: hypothetical protein E6R08_06480 [Nevskiaceae bacterium]|nr:MAG: hypothetical protein E6R08_06480 [Nevskiaceae bacterium]
MLDLSGIGDFAAKVAGEVLPAAAGAVVSVKFLPSSLSRFQRYTSVLSAYAIGTYVGRGLCEWQGITSERAVDAVVFGVAIFGMSFVGTAISEIKPALKALRTKFIGPAPSDSSKGG